MAETYYIRLPFYLLMATESRLVDINFDGVHISTAEITATDRNSMNNITFSVTKDPGNYTLSIKPQSAVETELGLTTVCLDDVWISNDNINFYSIIMNYNNMPGYSNSMNKSPTDEIYGFNPKNGAAFYNDVEFNLEIILNDAANWSKIYNMNSVEKIAEKISAAEAANESPEIVSKMKIAYDLFKERGYS
jgi:hypothetical protein